MKLELSANIDAMAGELRSIQERLQDLSPPMEAIADAGRAASMDRFDQETDFAGVEWRALSTYDPDYLAEKLAAGHDKKNVRQGTLRNDVHWTAEGDSVRFGVSGASEQYAGVRQADMGFLPVDENGEAIDLPGTPSGDLWDEAEATLADYLFGPER